MSWKFIKDAPVQSAGNGFWYSLNNGYIKLEEILKDKDLKEAQDAVDLLSSLEYAMEEEGLLEEM